MSKRLFSYALILILITSRLIASDFKAYYTRTAHKDRHSGKWADVIVEIGKMGKLIFGRETDFLPIWKTDSGTFRLREIIERQDDPYQYYSYVRIIKNTPDSIVIHWRYIPNLAKVDFRGVVHEIFIIKPDGRVARYLKQATERIDDWEDPLNVTSETLILSKNGFKTVSVKSALKSKINQDPINGLPVVRLKNEKPLIQFHFDERMGKTGNFTFESVSDKLFEVEGHKTLWKKGISGTSLNFDGYYSAVRINGNSVPNTGNEFTIEGWIALSAYPFDWAPIIHQSIWGNSGFYLGVDQDGFPGFHAAVGDYWVSAVDSTRLDLYQWNYISATFSSKSGLLCLYINGEKKVTVPLPDGKFKQAGNDLLVGLNSQKMPAFKGRISIGKWPSLFGIEGLIDEIGVFENVLTPKKIVERYKAFNEVVMKKPDLQLRRFPVLTKKNKSDSFGAQYVHLNYYNTWDNMWRVTEYSDVVVNFDELPVHLVSWRGLSYGPAMVTENGKWAGDQSSENYRELDDPSNAEGCCEHMSDKQCRHARVRIIENNDARVVLHFRYGMIDSRYIFVYSGHDSLDLGDEYWTIYPDGIMVRHLARGPIWADSWVETMFFSEPGTRPEDNIDLKAYTLVNMIGEKDTYSWAKGSPECTLTDPVIAMINMKSKYKPFNIYPTGSEIQTFPGHNKRSHFHWWNHWPVSQVRSDGRSARAPDRAAHSSLVWGIPSKPYLIYGMTSHSPESLIQAAKSWNNPAELINLTGGDFIRYNQAQRAYEISADKPKIKFVLNGTDNCPVYNPCIVIKGWKDYSKNPEFLINGTEIRPGKTLRSGCVWDTDGSAMMVVWIEMESIKPVKIQII